MLEHTLAQRALSTPVTQMPSSRTHARTQSHAAHEHVSSLIRKTSTRFTVDHTEGGSHAPQRAANTHGTGSVRHSQAREMHGKHRRCESTHISQRQHTNISSLRRACWTAGAACVTAKARAEDARRLNGGCNRSITENRAPSSVAC